MAHLNLQSGVPKVVASGVLVGATDFREFPVGVGLPAGITPFGSTTSIPDPLLVEIGNDGFPAEVSEEGHHFAMTGRGGENWGYGLDSFFGQMDRGEMRAIVRSDFRGGFEDFPIGAAAGMQGANNADWRAWIGTQFLRGGVNDIESSGKTTFAGFGNTMFGIMDNDLQEPFIAGINVNVRIRRVANPGDPANRDDWEIRSWYGGTGAEPVLPDDDAINQTRFDSSLQAIGWGQLPQGPFNPVLQKIRFLSFSVNPLVEPAPEPSDIAAVSPWVPSGNMVPVLTDWAPEEQQIIPGGPKPLTILRPIVEFDVRQVRDDPQYNDGDNLVPSSGGVGWKDLETSDPQGRTDAGSLNASGNVFFVEDGWTPGIDAVRFVGFPEGAPTNPIGSRLPWAGGGIGPSNSNWAGNNYSIFGVMRATDITQLATFFGSTAGLSPNFPKKVQIWVQPDGSVAVHHTDEENVATLQPGSSFSLETAPGIVKPGDDLIISLTASAIFGPRQGKILRINGVEVARNDQAFATFVQENVSPTIGEGFPEQLGPGPGSIGGLDRLIVYMSAYGSLATAAEVRAYESFLAGAFQFNFATQWVPSG